MSDAEPGNSEDTWSDRLKRRIKPEWMAERDKARPPGKADWRLGHLLWVMTLGSPAEVDAFSTQMDRAMKGTDDAAKTNWQERESSRAGADGRER
jgi:hypothetical protein